MILFYNKKTGDIIGTIDGRVHPEDHLKMWIGSKEENDRLIIQWKQIEKDGVLTADFEPDYPQKDLIRQFEKDSTLLKKYRINLQNHTLTEK